MGGLRNQRGLAMASVLLMVFVLAVISALVLYLSGKEIALTAVRRTGAQSLYVAEGGATSARSALLALMNADPVGTATLDPSLTSVMLTAWYAGGNPANGQNSFSLLDYIMVDGQRYTTGADNSTNSLTFHVNWSLPQVHRKLQLAGGPPPVNSLGGGTYSATVVLTRRLVAHPSCVPPDPCYIHRLGPDDYEFFYTYTVTSDGQMPPRARRRVTLSRDFSVHVRRQSFAGYALFTNSQLDSSGGTLVYFNRTGEFDGPVHTNGQFGFREFPKFGTPDPNIPCDLSRIQSAPLTSVNTQAWFYNNGSPVQRAANENVVSGVRRDAPVLPDCTSSQLDDGDNAAANFTRGVTSVPFPANAYSQKGVSIGRDPADTSPVSNMQIRQAVPQLADNGNAVPPGIYVPVVDANGNSVSDANEALGGGIYVQGNLTSLTLSTSGNNAVYTLVLGAQTVTVTVDRTARTTTVTDSTWAAPQTRTFSGVPKGWQQPGNDNAMVIYVEGTVNALSGTLEEKEQATIATSGTITISDHLLYEDPPDVNDPSDNPLNLLGLFTTQNIMIGTSAPNDVNIHAILMAGISSDAFGSGVSVVNYNDAVRGSRGSVHLIGGVIEEFYPPFGTLNADGSRRSGYGRDFNYDRRMNRGFAPPFFPTTNRFEFASGSQPLAGARPVWREASP